MLRYLSTLITLLFASLLLLGQSSDRSALEVPRFIKTWKLDEQLGFADTLALDTTHINYNFKNLIHGHSISNSYNANYGSPLLSKTYANRIDDGDDFIFGDVYRPYIWDASTLRMFDVNFPYSNLSYLSGGPNGQKEEHLKFQFAAGPSSTLNFGTNLDYIHSIGMFQNQEAQRFGGNVFARFAHKQYSANAMMAYNRHMNYENGGLTNLTLLNNPQVDVRTRDMPVAMSAYSSFKKLSALYNQTYSVGFNRKMEDEETDSIWFEYVPVTRFGHTIRFEQNAKRYFEPSVVRGFYENTYLDEAVKELNDTAALRTLTNVFSVNLAEEFNKWLKFGVTGYVENEVQQFAFRPDSLVLHELKSNTRVGGRLSKEQGRTFRYNFLGDIYLIGYKLGEFRIEGDAQGDFRIGKEPLKLEARAFVRNETPSLFLQNYYSGHFRWENSFTKEYKTHLAGKLALPKRHSLFHVGVENLTNPIYFDEKGLPTQYNGNVQVLFADLRQDVKLMSITLENRVVYQLSSNQEVLPLPDLALFHNLYYSGKWFKDLYPQIGVSMRYHTKYMAPSYMPAIAQFYNQKETLIGAYPELNVYANFHLKTARFFLEYTNLGSYFLDGWGFHMPNYPINPPMFKFGVLWNFFN